MRTIPMLCIASFLFAAAGCRRRPAATVKAVDLDEPAPPTPSSPTARPERRAHALEAPPSIAQVKVSDAAAPGPQAAKPAVPSVAQPYQQPTPSGGRLPMWKQRAKFY